MKSYIIRYKCFDIRGHLIDYGKFKVKNCDSELHAKMKFGEYLKRSVIGCERIEMSEPIIAGLDHIFGDVFSDLNKL